MAEAVILSAIESLDCWLLMKEENHFKKLYSLIVGMSDLGEEKKEMVHTLLLKLGMEEYEDEDAEDEKDEEDEDEEEEWERNEKELYNLLDLNKEKMYSLVVGMADLLEDYKGKLYRLLFLVITTNQWGYKEKVFDKEKLHSLLVEITDMWGDEEGELNKEKLHSLLFQMMDWSNYSKGKMMRRISGEVAGLWKDKQPKLNKEKLYTWLANKLDLRGPEYLFRVLLEMVLRYDLSSLYFPKTTREGVEGAKTELGEILDLITDEKLGEESSLRYFISDVVDMAHHARFLIHLQDSHPFALFFQSSVLLQDYRYLTYYEWFGKKLEHIVNELKEIKMSMLGFRVERFHNVRATEGFHENVVGLEEDVKLLLNGEGNRETTVIAGMAGIGKTTLARQVYNHTSIAQQFQHRAWVCLSKVFSRKEMLVSLIRQMVDSKELEKIEHADYKSLKQVLRQQLLGMQYFIVLDDVSRNTTHLEYVQKALPKDKQGSRLLITIRNTRKSQLAILENYYHHDMKYMDGDKSWTLLLKTLSIEGCGEEFPKPLVKKAKQIVMRNCGGLPLAIKEVGRHWAKKRQSGSEWEELIESIDLTETLGVLESVYHNWDQELKSCFLHLAFFKEGATIRVKKLVQIWIVMGLEEIYIPDLREESIIDVISKDKTGDIKRCCIHAVFHKLAIMKAEDELNFEILSKDGNNRRSHQPHHRAIYCSREKLMNYSSNQDKHLVSLFFYGGGYFNATPSYWKNFEQLKTLDMEDFGLKILPDVIGMLTELRYLGLRNNYIQVLPHSLSRLKNLEVLDIAENFMVAVEDIIWETESLRHLYMSDISCRKPLRIDTLKNLETLTYVSVHNWTYEASRFEMMTSLTKLGIQEVDGNADLRKLFASLAKLESLQHLILRGFRFKSMPSLDAIGILRHLEELKVDGLITKLPSANNFPPSIKYLSLVNSCLHEDPMPILKKLLWLSYLKLQNAYTGQQMVISRNGFSFLKFLVIEELWHLTNVQIEEGAMQGLEELEINNCPNLETLPEDYCPINYKMMFKMKTTKKNATKIRESSFVSRIKKVDIQP